MPGCSDPVLLASWILFHFRLKPAAERKGLSLLILLLKISVLTFQVAVELPMLSSTAISSSMYSPGRPMVKIMRGLVSIVVELSSDQMTKDG